MQCGKSPSTDTWLAFCHNSVQSKESERGLTEVRRCTNVADLSLSLSISWFPSLSLTFSSFCSCILKKEKKVLKYWHWLNPVPAPCVSPPAKTEHEMKGSRWLCPLREIHTPLSQAPVCTRIPSACLLNYHNGVLIEFTLIWCNTISTQYMLAEYIS